MDFVLAKSVTAGGTATNNVLGTNRGMYVNSDKASALVCTTSTDGISSDIGNFASCVLPEASYCDPTCCTRESCDETCINEKSVECTCHKHLTKNAIGSNSPFPACPDDLPETTVYSTAGLEGISVPSLEAMTKIEHDHFHKVSVTSHPKITKEVSCVAAVTKKSADEIGERIAKGVETSDHKSSLLANDFAPSKHKGEAVLLVSFGAEFGDEIGPIVASIEIKVCILEES